jgi:hypothetical protein
LEEVNEILDAPWYDLAAPLHDDRRTLQAQLYAAEQGLRASGAVTAWESGVQAASDQACFGDPDGAGPGNLDVVEPRALWQDPPGHVERATVEQASQYLWASGYGAVVEPEYDLGTELMRAVAEGLTGKQPSPGAITPIPPSGD